MNTDTGKAAPASAGRGVAERDVWSAADALLLAGQRPTIERVRQRIGRGSPNTVSLHLETWFAGLGVRLADPAAFVASGRPAPGWPPAVADAMAAVWDVARREAGVEAEARLAEAREQARIEAAEANARADAATRRADGTAEELRRSGDAIAALRADLANVRADAARLHERLDATAIRLTEEQRGRMDERGVAAAAQAALAQQRDAADERAAAAERRFAVDLDRERVARAEALRRAETLDARLLAQARELSVVAADADRLRLDAARRDVRHQAELDASRRDERGALDRAEAAEAQIAALRAEGQRAAVSAVPASARSRKAAAVPLAGVSSSGALRRASRPRLALGPARRVGE